jgi:hypothetical protein
MSGAGTIQMTEQEETQSQGNGDLAEHTLDCRSMDEDEQDLWEALIDFWAGTSRRGTGSGFFCRFFSVF